MYRTFAPAEAPNSSFFAGSYDKQFEGDVKRGKFDDLRQWPAYIKKLSDEILKKYKGKAKFPFLNKSIELELDRRQIPDLWARYIAPLYTVGIQNIKQWANEAKNMKFVNVDQIKAFVQSKFGGAVAATEMAGRFMASEAEFQMGEMAVGAIVFAIACIVSQKIWMDIIRDNVPGISEEQIAMLAGVIGIMFAL
tara:strand:- start:65 stop:646 length:582 start_codon:yes stop_codon:yes gene_type:complete